MANMHILTRSAEKHHIACHISVPNSNNPAGVNYRTAIVNAGLATPLPDHWRPNIGKGDASAWTFGVSFRYW